MAARNTTEQSLRFSIALVTTAANGTRPRCVRRIDQFYWRTRELGLVADKQTQLAERPIAVSCALFGATNPNPRANAAQIFKCNRSFRVFGLSNNVLTDTVILVCLKATLASRQLLQAPFGRLGANSLKGGAAIGTALPDLFNCLTGVCLTIGIRGDVYDTQIDAQNTLYVNWFRFLNFGSWNQIPTPLDTGKIALTYAPVKQFALAWAAHKGNSLPTANRPNRNRGEFIGQNALIKRNRAKWFEYSLRLLVEFVSVGDFSNTAHNQLRAQPGLLTNIVIDQAMNIKLLERTQIPGHLTDLVTSGVSCLERLVEQVSLYRSWLQLKLYSKSHNMTIPQIEYMREKAKAAKAVRFLPRLKRVGFRA